MRRNITLRYGQLKLLQMYQYQLYLFINLPPVHRNSSAVIIAPGGALYAHSINNEGKDVAKYLAKKGFTAFVLKYHLVPTDEDAIAEISKLSKPTNLKLAKKLPK